MADVPIPQTNRPPRLPPPGVKTFADPVEQIAYDSTTTLSLPKKKVSVTTTRRGAEFHTCIAGGELDGESQVCDTKEAARIIHRGMFIRAQFPDAVAIDLVNNSWVVTVSWTTYETYVDDESESSLRGEHVRCSDSSEAARQHEKMIGRVVSTDGAPRSHTHAKGRR